MKRLIPLMAALLLMGCSMRLPFLADKTSGGPAAPVTSVTEQAATQVFLHRAGLGFFLAGVLALLTGFFFSSKLGTAGDYIRSGGLTAFIAGAIFLFIAAYVKALYWSVGMVVVGCVACGVLWIIAHRKDLVPYFGKAAVKAAGNVGL